MFNRIEGVWWKFCCQAWFNITEKILMERVTVYLQGRQCSFYLHRLKVYEQAVLLLASPKEDSPALLSSKRDSYIEI